MIIIKDSGSLNSYRKIMAFIDNLEIRDKDWDTLNSLLKLDASLFISIMESLADYNMAISDLESFFETDKFEDILIKNILNSSGQSMSKINEHTLYLQAQFGDLGMNVARDAVSKVFRAYVSSDEDKFKEIRDINLSDNILDVIDVESEKVAEVLRENEDLRNLLFYPPEDNISLSVVDIELTNKDMEFMIENSMSEIEMKRLKSLVLASVFD